MDEALLRSKLIQLIYEKPELRDGVLPLLESFPEEVVSGEPSEPPPPPPDKEPPVHVPDRASEAIESELLPLAKRMESEGWSPEHIKSHLNFLVQDAFKNKHGLWNTLVYYQSTHENEQEFRQNLESAIEHVVSQMGG